MIQFNSFRAFDNVCAAGSSLRLSLDAQLRPTAEGVEPSFVLDFEVSDGGSVWMSQPQGDEPRLVLYHQTTGMESVISGGIEGAEDAVSSYFSAVAIYRDGHWNAMAAPFLYFEADGSTLVLVPAVFNIHRLLLPPEGGGMPRRAVLTGAA